MGMGDLALLTMGNCIFQISMFFWEKVDFGSHQMVLNLTPDGDRTIWDSGNPA